MPLKDPEARKEYQKESHRSWYVRNREKRYAEIKAYQRENFQGVCLSCGGPTQGYSRESIPEYCSKPGCRSAQQKAYYSRPYPILLHGKELYVCPRCIASFTGRSKKGETVWHDLLTKGDKFETYEQCARHLETHLAPKLRRKRGRKKRVAAAPKASKSRAGGAGKSKERVGKTVQPPVVEARPAVRPAAKTGVKVFEQVH